MSDKMSDKKFTVSSVDMSLDMSLLDWAASVAPAFGTPVWPLGLSLDGTPREYKRQTTFDLEDSATASPIHPQLYVHPQFMKEKKKDPSYWDTQYLKI